FGFQVADCLLLLSRFPPQLITKAIQRYVDTRQEKEETVKFILETMERSEEAKKRSVKKSTT
ncbi:MAG: hypothetical protein ACRECH_15315, partial [Nitrososphaerales archaeon]